MSRPFLTADEKSLLARTHAAMVPLAEPYFRRLFADATGTGETENLPPHYLKTEFEKLRLLCAGDFGPALLAIQRNLIDQLLKAGMTKDSYITGYGFYLQHVTACALDALGPDDPDARQVLALLQRVVMKEGSLAIGYFDAKVQEQIDRDRNDLADAFRTGVAELVGHLNTQIGAITSTAGGLERGAMQTDRFASTSQKAAESASTSVKRVAAASAQLRTSIEEVTAQIGNASTALGAATARATDATRTVDVLTGLAKTVGSVVDIIDRIAEQTNMLAINATIEAARAGDAGRGFAVVAGEVKKLANETRSETVKIADAIHKMQAAVLASVKAMGEVTETVSSANDLLSRSSRASREQANAAREIADSVENAAEQTQVIAKNGQELIALVGETAGAAERIREITGEAADASAHLARSVDDFLGKIAAEEEAPSRSRAA